VELGHFRGTIQSELSMLQRLRTKPENASTHHIARSSNLPFLETLWNTAKLSRDVVAMQKRVFTSPMLKSRSQGLRHARNERVELDKPATKDSMVLVDAIVNGGRTWIKVSLVTNSRLLFDLAKQGWDSGGSDYEGCDENGSVRADDGADGYDVPLLKTAKQLTKAAKCFRVRTKLPQVHLVLPRIISGQTPEVDAILDDCRATGAVLICGARTESVPNIDKAVLTMARDPIDDFSNVLNIDCTILLAIVSEFSHAKVSKEPWFHRGLRRQVEIEDNENLLPSLLYPALGSHELVCTEEAAKRMREIVDTIGTPSERARTAILLGDHSSKSQAELVTEMQEWSAYQVPIGLQLPIRIVDQNEGGCQAALPQYAQGVSSNMTAINRSVFLYGWATGCTTITSNRAVMKQIENDMDALEDLDESSWPSIHVWLCPTARSLVGKEKR
ncbi:hypothetical protein BAUCODRAFT_59588, partial [Baudoinia panamericana UAMH 10762]